MGLTSTRSSCHDLRRGCSAAAAVRLIQNSCIHAVACGAVRICCVRPTCCSAAWHGAAHLDRSRQCVAVHRLRGNPVGRPHDGRAPEPMYSSAARCCGSGVCTPRPSSTCRRQQRFAPASPLCHLPQRMSFGAAAASRRCRAGWRSSCCSRTARCACCTAARAGALHRQQTRSLTAWWLTVLSSRPFTIATLILLAMAKERTELVTRPRRWSIRTGTLTAASSRSPIKRQQAEGRQPRSARRSRPLQVDQRSLRPCRRRPGAADFRRRRHRQARA